MKVCSLIALAVVAGAAGSASALTFQCRYIERVGNNNVVLATNTIDATNGLPRRIRMQFRVVEDGMGASPAGGFVGMNVGTLTVSGDAANSNETRTNGVNVPGGRLAPYNFSGSTNANGNPPLPGGDPFTMLTDIDATLGTQSPIWVCDAAGNAPAQPPAVVTGRGLTTNTLGWVSLYEFTVDPNPGAVSYTVTAGGNLIAATDWLVVGSANGPDCGDPSDPTDDIPGAVTYAPFPTNPVSFTCVLNVNIIPAPGAAALLGLGGLLVARRRRA